MLARTWAAACELEHIRAIATCFDSLPHIRHVGAPVLIIHGERDTLIPATLGRALFAAAREPKHALWIANGGHNDLWGRIRETVMAFAARRGL
jgi:fermentation-respiration switch protein FrsA (DUF1100 family)